MKKIIPFEKDLIFKTRVSEVTSISLEHSLDFVNEDEITGEFLISGDYKMTEGSINREDFFFRLPFDIVLDSRYDKNNIVIDVDDFYYEVINDEILRVNIDVYVEGEPIIVEETKIDEPIIEPINNEEHLDDIEVEIDDEDKRMEIKVEGEDIEINVPEVNLFDNLDSKETFATYHVYLMKEEDTIEKIILKFNVTKEELNNYNDLENIKVGDKLIIPTNHNE